MNKNTRNLTFGAAVSALYVILTLISNQFGLANGFIQLRLSEALYVFALFNPYAVFGLFIGCIISNLITGAVIYDVIFGSIATLIGAYFTHILKKNQLLALSAPILSNTLIIPFILRFAYGIPHSILYFALTIGISETISCGVFGYLILKVLKKRNFPGL